MQNKIGYARISSVDQNLDSQTDALQQAGCAKIFSEKPTGSRMDRPVRKQVQQYVRCERLTFVLLLKPCGYTD